MSQAELDRLAAEAAHIEATDAANLPPMPGEEPPAPEIDPAQAWIEAARMGADMVTAAVPELAPAWTRERVDNFGAALARCADHYGWEVGEIFGHPLVGLAVASFPLATSAYRVLQDSKAAQKKPPKPAPAGAPVAAPDPAPVAASAQPIQLNHAG